MKTIIYGLILSFSIFSCNNSIEDQVVKQSLSSYDMAKKGGDPIEIQVEAEGVAEAYKMAGDEENYLKWKKIAQGIEAEQMRAIEKESNDENNKIEKEYNDEMRAIEKEYNDETRAIEKESNDEINNTIEDLN